LIRLALAIVFRFKKKKKRLRAGASESFQWFRFLQCIGDESMIGMLL